MKFYELNYLNYADITKSGFYIYTQRKPDSHDLSEYPKKLDPCDTVLTVNFTPTPTVQIPVQGKSSFVEKQFGRRNIALYDPDTSMSGKYYFH